MKNSEKKVRTKNSFRKQILRFIMVGFGNTVLGMTIIYILYNQCGLGYWLSSGLGFAAGSIWSFFFNKYFTFQYKERDLITVIKFLCNTIICYVMAYTISKPAVKYVFTQSIIAIPQDTIEQIALFLGSGIYIILNFFGQKFFCFNSKFVKKQQS